MRRATASKLYISKCNAKCWMQWCKARRHWTLEQWRRILRVSPSGNLMDMSGFGSCQENGSCLTALCQVYSLVEGGLWCGVVLQELAWPLSSSERNSECFSILRDVGQFHAPTLWEQFGHGPFLFQHDCAPVCKAKSIKTWMREFGVDELILS